MKTVFNLGGWVVKERSEACYLVYMKGSRMLYACKGSFSEAVAYCYS